MLHRRGRRRIPRVCVLAGLGAARVRRSGPTPVGAGERGSGLTSPKGVTVAGPSRIHTGVPPRLRLIVPQAGLMDSWTSSFSAVRRRPGS